MAPKYGDSPNSGGGETGTLTLEGSDSPLTGKQAANRFADNYEDVSNIPISRDKQIELRGVKRERRVKASEEEIMEKDLSLIVLQVALRQLKGKKSYHK